MGSTLVYTGDRIDNDNNKPVFVIGAYRLGPVIIRRQLLTTACHPGEWVEHTATAGGEDSVLLGTNANYMGYGISELDKGLVDDCSEDYTVTTHVIPVIPYHMNPGALLRNIQCVDPGGSDVSPDEPLCTISGTAGAFIAHHTGDTFTDSDTSDGEAFSADTTEATIGAQIRNRMPMRQAYFLSDPSAAYTDVAYIWQG